MNILFPENYMNWLFAFFLSLLSSFAYTHTITTKQYADLLKDHNACFILYHINQHKIVSEFNPLNRCNERIAPDSTFKIALSLMAFNQGIITQNTVFKWDGVKDSIPGWNRDQTPKTWLQYSVVWVSQQITRQMGMNLVTRYLAGFNYGNQNFRGDPGLSNGLTHAWLSSSLKISAQEQLTFLTAMLEGQLPLTPDAVKYTKANLYLGKLDNGFDYYGKTGSGRHGRNERMPNPSRLREGWFVGFVEDGAEQYIFVSNMSDKTEPGPDEALYGSQLLKPIALKLLNTYFSD